MVKFTLALRKYQNDANRPFCFQQWQAVICNTFNNRYFTIRHIFIQFSTFGKTYFSVFFPDYFRAFVRTIDFHGLINCRLPRHSLVKPSIKESRKMFFFSFDRPLRGWGGGGGYQWWNFIWAQSLNVSFWSI